MRNRDAIAKAAQIAAKCQTPLTAKQARMLLAKYSPDQPRDDQGQWTAGGVARTALTAGAIVAGLAALPILAGAGSTAVINRLSRRLARQMEHTRRTYKPKPVRAPRPTDPKIPGGPIGTLLLAAGLATKRGVR